MGPKGSEQILNGDTLVILGTRKDLQVVETRNLK
jgi:K+/H+ antiporter YhaU regulatory subunit KhtT